MAIKIRDGGAWVNVGGSGGGGSSFCSGVVRGWGVFDVFRDTGSGGANQLTFYNGM